MISFILSFAASQETAILMDYEKLKIHNKLAFN